MRFFKPLVAIFILLAGFLFLASFPAAAIECWTATGVSATLPDIGSFNGLLNPICNDDDPSTMMAIIANPFACATILNKLSSLAQ